MNDRFKFRAWDKTQNKMYYDVEMTYDYPCEPRGAEASSFGSVLMDDDYIVMQCTGLADKNGKLIYEGDILGGIYHGYISYCNECKCFQLFVDKYGCLACEGDLHWYELVEAEEQNELEVIGNIYENEDLLNE